MMEENNLNNTGDSGYERKSADDTKNGKLTSAENGAAQHTTVKKKKRKKKSGLAEFKSKCRELVTDKRPWYKRLICAALASLAFTYTIFVFGPLEVFLPNIGFYTFTFGDLIGPLTLLGLGIFAGLTLVLFLLRGKIFNYAVTVVFSTTVCAYIQCNMMNSLSALDGTGIAWETMTKNMLINAAIWAVIFLIPFIVHYFSRKVWRRMVTFVSALIIAVQSAGLVQLLILTDFNYATGYLSNKEIFNVSEEKNVIVFLLDRCAFSTLEKTFNMYPDTKEGLADFISYDNAVGSYSRTYPSVCYLLTGVHTDYSEPVMDYLKKAWTTGSFLSDIKSAGYESRVYTEVNYVIKNTANVIGKIDNVGQEVVNPDSVNILGTLLDLSLYRYTPLAMKPFFWCYTGDFEGVGTAADGSKITDIHRTNDAAFYEKLRTEGLTVDGDSKGAFIFYHMKGSHDPFQMDENGNYTPYSTAEKQTAGNLRMILDYIKLLKEKNLYDNTTIIITADHGLTGTISELDGPRTISLLVKYPGVNDGKPLTYNSAPVSHDNIRATILKELGIDYSAYGPAIDDVAEDAEVTRYFYMSGADGNPGFHRDHNFITYKIDGNANDFNNWTIVDKKRIEYPFYDAN